MTMLTLAVYSLTYSYMKYLVHLYSLMAAIGLSISLYLASARFSDATLVCGITECGVVNNSKYSILLGLPISIWGVLFYSLSLFLAIKYILLTSKYNKSNFFSKLIKLPIDLFNEKYHKMFLLVLGLLGVLFSAYLTYLEAFVIGAWCQWCIASAWICVSQFILAILIWRTKESDT